MQGSTPNEVMNFDEALENVGGSEDLLVELADALKSELPQLMDSAREAIDAGDPAGVNSASHSIKGSLTPFAAKLAYDAAWELERNAAEGDLSNAPDQLKQLAEELDRLTQVLDQFKA
jgi:HPt (histidine-containing phosphotransfer) domain-containing protein